MPTYTDENGNAVEFEIDPVEMQTKLKEMEEENEKFKSRDFNFKEYRRSDEHERKEMMKKFSVKERQLVEGIDGVKKELEDYKERNHKTHKERVLTALVGKDDELKAQVEEAYKGFVGDAQSEEEVTTRMQNAYTLVKGSRPTVDLMNQYVPSVGSQEFMQSRKAGERFTETDRGKDFYKANFPSLAAKAEADAKKNQ